MNRRRFLVAGGAAAAGALAGCIGQAQEDGLDGASRGTIRVSSAGEVTAEPDMAVVQVGVQSTGADAESVRNELSTRSQSIREALLEAGVAEDDITTGRFYIRERREHRGEPAPDDGEPVPEDVYYVGEHTLTVEVDADDAAGVVDEAVAAGATDVGRVQFTLRPETRESLREEALEVAIDDAREDAERIASNVNRSIVDIKSIDAADGGVRPVYQEAADAGGDGGRAVPTELYPDDVTVSARVEIVYYIA